MSRNMKRKQNQPRRVRPAETPDGLDKEASAKKISDHFCDETEPKRLKSHLETPTENGCDATDSEWKWKIADFRKEHAENTKELLADSNEQSKNCKGHSDQLEQLPNDSKDPSMNSKESSYNSNESCDNLEPSNEYSKSSKESFDNLECLKECVKNATESSESSKEWVNNFNENEKNSEEVGESLKEFNLRNPPQILRNQMGAAQDWKLPVRILKKPSSSVNQIPSSSEVNSNPNLPEKNEESKNFKNELQNDDMPVILNVFSLSKESAPAKQFVTNTKQENSVLFTPPCTPPLVQLGPFNAIPVSSQNSRFRNDFAKQAASTLDANEQWREFWYNNKPVKRVYRNSQGYLSYQVNSSQEYSNKPVQQVYYNPQQYLTQPAQQVSSQVYSNKPVQLVYRNPLENSPKPAQQAHSQEYFKQSVQRVNPNPTNYLTNPVQQTNPQEYLYNSAQHTNYNPRQIANGVLPLEKQSSNQGMYDVHQPNTTQYYTQGYYDYVNNNEQAPISTSSHCYLVKRGSSLTKGNGTYAQFKLRQEMVEFPQRPNFDVLPQVFETPSAPHRSDIYIPPIVGKTQTTQHTSDIYIPPMVTNQADMSRDTTVIFSNPPSTLHSQNGGNGLPNSDAVSVDKYRTENGCSAVLDGYGRNIVLGEGAGNPTIATNNPSYNAKPLHLDNSYGIPTIVSENKSLYSENPYGTPTMDSEKQFYSENAFGSPTMVPGNYGVTGEPGNTAESFRELLSPRDAKVIELKQRLEEQEATLKKLRANQ